MLAEKEMKKNELRERLQISASTLTKLNKGETVSLDILIKICAYFECNIGDICDVVPDNTIESR